MYQYEYPYPAVTTDIVIFTSRDKPLKLLLIMRGGEPYKGNLTRLRSLKVEIIK